MVGAGEGGRGGGGESGLSSNVSLVRLRCISLEPVPRPEPAHVLAKGGVPEAVPAAVSPTAARVECFRFGREQPETASGARDLHLAFAAAAAAAAAAAGCRAATHSRSMDHPPMPLMNVRPPLPPPDILHRRPHRRDRPHPHHHRRHHRSCRRRHHSPAFPRQI